MGFLVMWRRIVFLFLLQSFLSGTAYADWWNKDWAYRKEISVDSTAITAAGITQGVKNVPVLLRFHTANFGYFLDVKPKGDDLRFIAADGLTPLKFHIEKFDAINEMAFIWVQLPDIQPGAQSVSFYMYYGNEKAVAAADPAGTYDADQTLVYHFSTDTATPVDVTAYASQPSEFTGQQVAGGLIAAAAKFDGTGLLRIPDSPALNMDSETGWTMSAWIKIDQPQEDTVLVQRAGDEGQLVLGIDGQSPYVKMTNADGIVLETARNITLPLAGWHHLAVTGSGNRLTLFIDGKEVNFVETSLPVFVSPITVAAAADGSNGFSGLLDELQFSKIARSPASIALAALSQGTSATLVSYGEDGSQDNEDGGGDSYFLITLHNVTLDGWAVIIVLAVMFAISMVVMAAKAMVVNRVSKDNAAFLRDFEKLGATNIGKLDSEDVGQLDSEGTPLLTALSGRHKHYESSTLYRVYHAGVQGMEHRMPRAVGAAVVKQFPVTLSAQAVNAIKATMDGSMVREIQKLNSLMVLLTIAISGGPFLGLLGTVVGVMITFAAIAASGDVNVNAIAPGIAAALVATVAGLAVAIPALFGYNYLGSRIKEITADMHVFVDEFVARIAEQHS